MTFQSFYDLRVAGIRPSDVMGRDKLMWFAEKATIYQRRPPSPDHVQTAREIGDRLGVEFATDPELWSWFVDQLPPDIRAEAVMAQDEADRPFPLEAADGPHHCSSCGEDKDGPHVEVVIRDVAVADTGIDISYCLPCIRAVTSQPR